MAGAKVVGGKQRFAGKVALVTGGGAGIGRASAVLLGAEGASVVVADLQAETAAETVSVLADQGSVALAVCCDVRQPSQVAAMVEDAVAEFGRLDMLHNNAGVLIPGSALTQTLDDWHLHFAVNVTGMLLVAREVIPHMQRQGGGAIVNTASTAALVGEQNAVAYDSTKGAVVSFTRQLALDFAGEGIRVNCVCPGWIDTGFNDPLVEDSEISDEELANLIQRSVPLNRQGVAEDVAPAVAFLLSNDASYITGHPLVIDGGLIAQ